MFYLAGVLPPPPHEDKVGAPQGHPQRRYGWWLKFSVGLKDGSAGGGGGWWVSKVFVLEGGGEVVLFYASP